MDRIKKKICLLGDPGVGKTSLIRRFVLNSFDEKYLSTLGTHVTKKEMFFKKSDTYLEAMIWDIAGQKEMKRIQATGLQNSAGVILVGDLSRPDTILSLSEWKTLINDAAGDVPILYVLNKSDLCEDKEQLKGFQEHVEKAGMMPIVASAKTGTAVEKSFLAIGELVLSTTVKKPLYDDEIEELVDRVAPQSIMEAEDELISLYVDLYGDEQMAMSVVRQQFKKRGVDFRNATHTDLVTLVGDLMEVVGDSRPKEDIAHTKKAMRAVLKSLNTA